MIFKINTKSLSVYDPQTESFIAEFKDGMFETEDEKIIEAMKRLGYVPELEVDLDDTQTPLIELSTPTEGEKKRGRPKGSKNEKDN